MLNFERLYNHLNCRLTKYGTISRKKLEDKTMIKDEVISLELLKTNDVLSSE